MSGSNNSMGICVSFPELEYSDNILHRYTQVTFHIPKLLPSQDQYPSLKGRKTLVLDLDETLVHSYNRLSNPDAIFPIELNGHVYDFYVKVRPYAYELLEFVSKIYEVVIFTASQQSYADPVIDFLDKGRNIIHHRLYRDSCTQHLGNYVKDLSQLNRQMKNIIIIDNSPHCYLFQPENALPVTSWYDDPSDTELFDIKQLLLALSNKNILDVRDVLMPDCLPY